MIDSIGDLVVYKNNQLIAFNKPAGVATQQDQTNDKSLLDLAEIYCHTNLHLVNRLDRPASGLVLMARTNVAAQSLAEQFKNRSVKKIYLAVVQNEPETPQSTLLHYLKKSPRSNRTVAFPEPVEGAKEATLEYEVFARSDRYTILKIYLQTGRHHQIRAQLAAINCPIKGDIKYGARRKNKDRSIDLHAWKLGFRHPVSGEEEWVEAPLPEGPIWGLLKS
jgi:23S rRNA pseudouridine1911/1915/1917 synthase